MPKNFTWMICILLLFQIYDSADDMILYLILEPSNHTENIDIQKIKWAV